MKKLLFVLWVVWQASQAVAQSPEYEAKKKKALAEISPFEKIAQHSDSVRTLEYEDEDLIAFEPLKPQAPVHFLIVPKRRINTLNDATAQDQMLLGKMLLVAKDIAKKKGIDQTGYRIAMNTNEDAGQSVFHIHLHLLGGIKVGAMVDQTYRNNQKKAPEKKD